MVEVVEVPKSGKWILKESDEELARASFDQKEDAIAAGKLLSQSENAPLKVEGEKGSASKKSSATRSKKTSSKKKTGKR